MNKKIKRDLGAMEAHSDPKFKEHFIEVQDLDKILDDDSDIVFGLKGSGKSALCRALNEIKKDDFLVTKIINLDSLSFTQIHAALISLQATTHKELIKLASHTWRNVLLLYSIEAYASLLPEDNKFKKQVDNLVLSRRYTNTKSNSRILNYIQNLIDRIAKLGYETKESSPLGLTQSQFEEVDKKYDDELFKLFEQIVESIASDSKKVLICLDGFDSIIDHSEESRKAIFSGLVDAIYKNSKDRVINERFSYKAFLPRELTDGVRNSHFDSDKFIFNRHYLGWSIEEFKLLVAKRLMPYSKTKSNDFDVLWAEHMPDKVRNNIHSVEENTFEYIIRHTLYRPRHLLIHLQYIFSEWDKNNDNFKVHPSLIPKVVSRTNKKLAELISAELEYSIPGITQFLHSWNSISCTIESSKFIDRMSRMFGIESIDEERDLFDKLFNIGIIGYFKKDQFKSKPQGKMNCVFAYTNADLGKRLVYNSIDPGDIIALSPVFQEYCGSNYASYGYVCQKL
ncbi:hypothetical protein [uncultured Psychroserpens sp.]|uniref:P-loop ATPase, Sll1717 family n=1 Tax=uncultured Psychroserpens sp. TaxID=255436 RepID=UPI0026300BCA|nr:hypothetical protein [uncultured Psychroserpens sp.]